ncbi:hypothetical protein [Kitasatospora sp. NPDC101183]|uniref:hypothetical protein n=1 Tax=Kitasatospora sp. NPDC101183 TaxID=3364100 RepID=UPI00382389B2
MKIGWGFALNAVPEDEETARIHADVLARCDGLFARAREAGVLRPDTDLGWARRVYYALIHEAATGPAATLPDTPGSRAALVVDTLLRGLGPA